MNINFEVLLKKALQQFKNKSQIKAKGQCLSEEDIAAIIEEKVQDSEKEQFSEHIASCQKCAYALKENLQLAKVLANNPMLTPPEYVVKSAMDLLNPEVGQNILQIVLNFKEKVIELIKTTGEILIGPELVPVSVLRGNTKDNKFSDEIKVVKTFGNLLAEVDIEKRNPSLCDIEIRLVEKDSKQKARDIRITLTKNNREIESVLSQEGKAVFREVSADKYKIIVDKEDKKIGIIEISINSVP